MFYSEGDINLRQTFFFSIQRFMLQGRRMGSIFQGNVFSMMKLRRRLVFESFSPDTMNRSDTHRHTCICVSVCIPSHLSILP